jgi:glycosyltransferase involved in cell wall biosynthesis
MNITLLITTYRRPNELARCLESLKKQTRLADEVVVVVRSNDAETWALLKAFNYDSLPLRPVTVSLPGQVAALNAGLDEAQGDIIAITDDDAAPHSDWLARIESYFLLDSRLGGVGGRDWVYWGAELDTRVCEVVGRIQWMGRTVGNHHLGAGKPREVDLLKGANMSYRRAAIKGIRFDERLRGTGAQAHNDMAFSLAVKRTGWKLIYDPTVAVDHYAGERFDEDRRSQYNDLASINLVHNETLVLLEHLPPIRRVVFLTWALLIGTQATVGCLQWLRLLPSEGSLASRKLIVSLRGRWQGWRTWRQS